ncbi:hypothetical protein PsorP6_007073 [Peronosclerospora sorghi]|uniref:Uncharacterized protein n=1 Tax=Peronosclerospora sorghi TaxID=230839 RepID=A0ACC0W764_9STRA|nr:hypothetical protein PsorP6_007073 [Peronosclerospora sorghi]
MRATMILSPLMTSLLASFAGTIDANAQSLEHTGVRRLRAEAGGESGLVANKVAEGGVIKNLVDERNEKIAGFLANLVQEEKKKIKTEENARPLREGDQTKVDDEVENKS